MDTYVVACQILLAPRYTMLLINKLETKKKRLKSDYCEAAHPQYSEKHQEVGRTLQGMHKTKPDNGVKADDYSAAITP